MGTIKFVHEEQRAFVSVAERAKIDPVFREALERAPGDESRSETFTHHAGSADEPQLFEVRFPPGAAAAPHAHDTDEIIVVTAGEIRFGKQTYGVGSSVMIPKMTLYSFQAGPEGLTFLNFRPTRSMRAIFKDEFMAMRRAAHPG
ncbi:MAG: hypothetical protein AB7N61_27690 [Acidimicrobiia bacterium]